MFSPYLPLIASCISILCVLLLAVRRESREDGMTTSQRLKKYETRLAEHDVLHTMHTQARERLADDLRRDLKQVENETERRCNQLEKATDEIPKLRDTLSELRADVKRLPHIEKAVGDMNAMLLKFLQER